MHEEEKIKEILNEIKPFLESEGGNIEFIKFENNIVYIKMLGTCASCEFMDYTIYDIIENTLRDEIPTIEKVINISD